ncbi:MAG: hypothetical protein A2X56_13680 [Nitrospirae bacterium GWC2_57_13]|jgi:hypothetical protein|nr:MAG: hypothetical protein A2072_02380 [Nitrospirae bacterium GWC1_57_7]OGW28210.1 MAG: hypothetical protein A2X56_13680 [Nitrospirae bacterium GWC2_57_13]OGW43934.1 MAG: hypothetical protein A2X57_10060 [Nitrospirae bacterium GWD2_57_8]HAS52705.1 hypothetical protein [Nitrospiraceae bacterium]
MRMKVRMKLAVLAVVGASVLLSGCAAFFVTGYKALPSGQGVEVEVRNDSNYRMGVIRFPVARDCSGGMSDMTPDSEIKPKTTVTTWVPAGQAIAFHVWANRQEGQITSFCTLYGEFAPEAGQRYVLTFVEPTRFCTFHMQRRDQGGSKLVFDPTFKFRKRRDDTFWNTSPRCYPEGK